jgi:hypothetical protein
MSIINERQEYPENYSEIAVIQTPLCKLSLRIHVDDAWCELETVRWLRDVQPKLLKSCLLPDEAILEGDLK